MAAVMVPGRVVDQQQGDLADPPADLVRKLNLESPDGTVNGLDLIKADALGLTKWIAGLVGGGRGAARRTLRRKLTPARGSPLSGTGSSGTVSA